MTVKGISLYFIAVGVLQCIFALIIVVCSAIVLNKFLPSSYYGEMGAFATFGLFFVIPGILCIAAGTTRKNSWIIASIAINIITMLLSTAGIIVSFVFWISFLQEDACSSEKNSEGKCICFYDDPFQMSCKDGIPTRNSLGVLTVVHGLMIFTTLAGSILGCIGLCSSSAKLPTVIMDAGQTEPNVLIVSRENSDA